MLWLSNNDGYDIWWWIYTENVYTLRKKSSLKNYVFCDCPAKNFIRTFNF